MERSISPGVQVDPSDTRTVISRQAYWINSVLQRLKPDRPILLSYSKNFKGDRVPLASDEWFRNNWKFRYDGDGRVYGRLIMLNEIVLELDSDDWTVQAEEGEKLRSYLERQGVPHVMGYSGNKGLHFHIFLDEDKLRKVFQEFKDDDQVDKYRLARKTMAKVLIQGSGMNEKRAKVDSSRIEWSSSTQGALIREFGCLRDNGQSKTLITEIPREKPKLGSLPLVMPQDVKPWGMEGFEGKLEEEYQKEVKRAEKWVSEPLTVQGPIEDIPCLNAMLMGVPEGVRHNGGFYLTHLLALTGRSKDEASQVLQCYAKACNGDSDLERQVQDTVVSIYREGNPRLTAKAPLCYRIRQDMGEAVCNRKECLFFRKPKEEERIFNLRMALKEAEPFQDGKEKGFVIPSFGPNCIKTVNEWADVDEKLGVALSARAEKFDRILWPLPGRISLDEDPRNLLEDLVAFIKDYVEFPSERTYYAFAAWIICSHLIDWLSHAPRIIVNAPTEHGKGRVCKMVALLAYRGVYLGDPSIAVLYHLTSWERATIVIDELQDIAKSQKELFIRIMGVFKLGFDIGTNIPRMNPDNTEIDAFQTYSFWIVASKDFRFSEDQQNRSIMITMRKRTRELKPDPMNNKEALERASALRTRLYSLRIRISLGLVDVDPLLKYAYNLSSKKDFDYYEAEEGQDNSKLLPTKIIFSDRTRDKIRALAVPCQLFGHEGEVLTAIALSQERALMEERSTFDAQVFHALQLELDSKGILSKDEVNDLFKDDRRRDLEKRVSSQLNGSKKITVDQVRDRLEGDLKDRGDEVSERISTRTVGNILRNNLSFSTKEGAKRKHYLTPRGFFESYRSCLSAFGSRFDIKEEI